MSDSAATVEDRVKKILRDYMKHPEDDIESDAAFADLGLDSLDGLEMMFDFESEFDIEIPDEVASEIKTVKEAVERIEALQAGEGAESAS